jgi:hypothetical protein
MAVAPEYAFVSGHSKNPGNRLNQTEFALLPTAFPRSENRMFARAQRAVRLDEPSMRFPNFALVSGRQIRPDELAELTHRRYSPPCRGGKDLMDQNFIVLRLPLSMHGLSPIKQPV